ncbi:MAG: biopolymer transporter ExbD [Herminiimonas sp.]|uniref:ExbD/TolR family protein n=1 Tax=Herminiimonas sp. TaxID=1926289 RepID=UPI00271D5A51|nr:biopolymer transporter ExbD [Herminiimonas sp.]MDO9422210.1 biopolymer transporter ExbD [Herminiimonas sp.]
MALTFDNAEEDGVLSEINTTPLVDVMLVLLIIFLITIPVVTNTIKVNLPNETNHVQQAKPDNINLSVDKDGKIFWGTDAVGGVDALTTRLKTVSLKEPQPEIQIRGDGEAKYEAIGRVIFACQRAGIVKIGFVTEPAPVGA